MEDPCEECVVLPCCETMCRERGYYSTFCLQMLDYFTANLENPSVKYEIDFVNGYHKARACLKKVNERNRTLASSSTTSSSGGSSSPSWSSMSYSPKDSIIDKYAKRMARNMAEEIDNEILKQIINTPKQKNFQRRRI